MKKHSTLFSWILTLMMVPMLSYSQSNNNAASTVLPAYYAVKNALVGGDAAGAAKSAAQFATLMKGIDVNKLADKERQAFAVVQAKLIGDAQAIANSKDLAGQRASFQAFSDNMIRLVKASKPDSAVYVAFCPMKKASWLTNENSIKNPYYGSSMLTCGKVTETIR